MGSPSYANPQDFRGVFIDCQFGDVFLIRTDNTNIYANCWNEATPTGATASVALQNTADRGYHINHRTIFNLNNANFTSVTTLSIQNSAQTNDCVHLHSGWYFRGTLSTTPTFRLDQRQAFFGDNDPRYLQNCVFNNTCPWPNIQAALGNLPSIAQGNGYYRVGQAVYTDANAGYSNDPDFLEMGAPMLDGAIPGPGHELAGGDNGPPLNAGLEYDCLGRARDPQNVVRGPYAMPFIEPAIRPTIPVIQ